MTNAIWIGLFTPLAGFLLLTAFSSFISRRMTSIIACTTILCSFICFSTLLYLYTNEAMSPQKITLFSWIPVKDINADFTLLLDPLSLLMTLIITGVGFLIHVYSTGYMEHDEDYARYFGCMNFFVFSMLLLVLAGHLLVLFAGWEGVGLASYLLIGYYYTRPAAARAATKAFVVNRIGDLGLLLGILLTFTLFGTGDMSEIFERLGSFSVGAPILTVLTLLYFAGAVGKSAQLPLHVWLPDAMEGPTPVSALIHAATMVTAGVYLVVRMHPVFLLAPSTLHLIGIVGGVTSLFAALCAAGQNDLKRVLAYSTVSQLGLMFLACGVGAFYAAMFHLTNHAFMKALLFLSAGNVVHMMNGNTDMNKMGGLASKFPVTHWLFLIGVLAMSGIPPLAAFFSKDMILEADYMAGFKILYYVGLLASILTGFYLTRAYSLTFLGKFTLDGKIYNMIKEAPYVMLLPVFILGVLSIIGGGLGFSSGKIPILERLLVGIGITPAERELSTGFELTPEALMAILGALLGVGSAAFIYTRMSTRLGPTLQVLRKAFYIDEIYDAVIVRPLKALSRFIDRILEPEFFEGIIRVLIQSARTCSYWLQKIQSGQIRSYVAWMVVGSALLLVYFVL